jgi:hypothetical protein
MSQDGRGIFVPLAYRTSCFILWVYQETQRKSAARQPNPNSPFGPRWQPFRKLKGMRSTSIGVDKITLLTSLIFSNGLLSMRRSCPCHTATNHAEMTLPILS